MAGVFGVVEPGVESSTNAYPASRVAQGACESLRCYWQEARGLVVGSLYAGEPAEDCYDPMAGVGLIVHGVAIDPDTGGRASAQVLLDKYRQQGSALLERLDGGYLIVVLDWRCRQLLIANDRMATCPLHYHASGGRFAFGPDARTVITLLGSTPELDETGALEFLSMGYAVGARTLFEGIELLPPAQLLVVDLDKASLQQHGYWGLRFRPRHDVSEAQAAGELYDVLRSTVRVAMTPAPSRSQLLLTGGFDSRTLLALMCEQGVPPDQALTWGVADDIPASDVSIAAQIASHYDVPFRFLHYDHDTFAEQAPRWTRVGELGSDNLGNFIAGPDLLKHPAWSASAVLNGDQLLGIGGIPISRKDAFEVASGMPFSGPVAGLSPFLHRSTRAEAAERASAGLHRLAANRWSEPAKDIQDYLGYHLRIARWLNAPTFFREPLVPSLRPMLHQPVIELFETLPDWLRVDKRLLLAMLKRHLPQVLQWPAATASSLVDWDQAFTRGPGTSAFFRELLLDERLADSPLSKFLDHGAIVTYLERYMVHPPAPMSRKPAYASMITSLRRAGSRYKAGSLAISGAQRAINRLRDHSVGANQRHILHRIALLSLFLRVHARGGFEAPGHAATPDFGLDATPRWLRLHEQATGHHQGMA